MEEQPFDDLVTDLATANGWVVHDLTTKRAVIRFDLPSGRTQALYAIALGDLVELSVPSSLVFENLEVIPRDLMVTCLRRSARTKVGFWCLEQIEGAYVLSLMWNVARDQLTPELFGDVVRALVVGCDQLESDVLVDPAELDRELEELLEPPGDE